MSIVFYLLAALTLAGGAGGGAAEEYGALRAGADGGLCRAGAAFLNLDAQFAGFAQILVYIGAVAILSGLCDSADARL
jgi:NADH:ubiquinone oxidoreductase subunit 6 (subunit J)